MVGRGLALRPAACLLAWWDKEAGGSSSGEGRPEAERGCWGRDCVGGEEAEAAAAAGEV